MATFDLNTFDEFLVARIVKKFNSLRSGINFYRSCRGAKDFVDRVKPVWPHPHFHLCYKKSRRFICKDRDYETPLYSGPQLPLEFWRVENVYIRSYSEEFFMRVVLPEVQAMGAVEKLELSLKMWKYDVSVENLQLLMSAAKPKVVSLDVLNYDDFSPALKDVKILEFETCEFEERSLPIWESSGIFERMINRKIITWGYFHFHKEWITPFLENWLKGASTDSLQTCTYTFCDKTSGIEHMGEVMNHAGIQTLMKSCTKVPEGYILEREGHGQVRICIGCDHPRKIDFHFS